MVIRILLNPKSVDMEGVTTLAQAQAENEQLKQGIEERNRQAIAAWEARTGLKYDPEWQEHTARPDGPFREKTGSTIREGTIRNGAIDGEVREYRDGVLRKTAIYKNGSETGMRKLYRGDGTLALDRFFNEDGNAVEIHYGKDGKTEEYRLVLGKRKVLFDSRNQPQEQKPETGAEGASDLAGLAGNTALSVGGRPQAEAEALRDNWRTFRKDGMRPGFRRAANGKPSNLGEREWLLARTAAFKDVAGDWESLMKRRELDAAEEIYIVPNVIKADGGRKAVKVALEWAQKNLPVYAETEIGTLVADYRSVKHSLGHQYGQEKLDAVVSLKDGIHHAVYLGSLPDSTRATNGTLDHYFVYPAKYKGKRKLVFLRAIEDVNKNRVYVHEVFDEVSLKTDINKKSDPFQAGADTQSAAQPPRGIALYKKILKQILAVKPEDIKVALDENNEPLAREVRRVEGELGKVDAKPKPGLITIPPANTALSVGDGAYLDAVRRGDMGAVRRMVEERATEMGIENPIPEQTDAYKVRVSAPPKKTIKVYKVFTIDQAGRPTALFVSGMDALPMGVWLDAQDTWHFTAKNGKQYVPSTANPNGRGGKTGAAVEIPNEATRQELIKRGFLPQGSKAKTVVALAYRPGWHAGDMPFFPQGGVRRAGSNYGNVHHARQVVFECEMDADHDYTDEARRQQKALTKDGRVNEANADLQSMPEGGFYRYSTNPLTKGGKRGTWFISGSLKINRALTQGEADGILRENGFAPQEWEQGALDLAQLGYRGDESEAAQKTLAPVTYDDNGNVIPLSQRFNPENPDIRFSVGSRMGKLEADPEFNDVRPAEVGRQRRAGAYYPDIGRWLANTAFSIGERRKQEYRAVIAKKRPDLPAADVDAFMGEMEKLGNSKAEKAALHWFVKGGLQLPEDGEKLGTALKTAAKFKLDPFAFGSPDELLAEADRRNPKKQKLAYIDPDTVPELTNKRDLGHGVVVYDVEDSPRGQAAMRRIINSHLGREANGSWKSPWCLLSATDAGEVSTSARKYWRQYNKSGRGAAFYKGRLVAFQSSKKKKPEWWDLEDNSHGESVPIPQGVRKTTTGEIGVSSDKVPADIEIAPAWEILKSGDLRPLLPVLGKRGSINSGLVEVWNIDIDDTRRMSAKYYTGGELTRETLFAATDGLWRKKGDATHETFYQGNQRIVTNIAGHRSIYTNGEVVKMENLAMDRFNENPFTGEPITHAPPAPGNVALSAAMLATGNINDRFESGADVFRTLDGIKRTTLPTIFPDPVRKALASWMRERDGKTRKQLALEVLKAIPEKDRFYVDTETGRKIPLSNSAIDSVLFGHTSTPGAVAGKAAFLLAIPAFSKRAVRVYSERRGSSQYATYVAPVAYGNRLAYGTATISGGGNNVALHDVNYFDQSEKTGPARTTTVQRENADRRGYSDGPNTKKILKLIYENQALSRDELDERIHELGGNVAMSVGERPGRAPTVEPGGDVREAGEGALAWLRRKFVHSQTPVFDAVRRVMGVGREPPDALNVEAAAKNVHGKIRARQELLQRAYLEPLKAILAQPGMDRKRFDDYALALHALERNRMIQERSVVVDPTSGEVVDLGVEAGSGVTNAWAERVIREIQRDPFAEQYKEAANILAEMNRFVLRGAVADGLLTEAQARTWMRLSPHYVPLKSGGAAPGAIHKRATGRFTRPDSVLVNSMRQAYATVRNGELNRVNKTMADWIREYDPNGEQVGGTVPESHKHAKIKMTDPQYVPKGSTAEALLRERGIRLVETEDKGGYWVDTGVLPNALKRVVRESVPQGDDIVTFWENGERKFIRFEGKRGRDGRAENEAARIADALNFKNVLHKEGKFWDAIRGLTRWKANVSTSWNPTFIVRNMGADVFNTANLMMIEGKYAELARTMRNYPAALRTIARLHSLRREAGDSKMERMFARCFCAVFCW